MATFEHDAVIASLAARASDQVRSGIAALHAGDLLRAEVLLRAALATFDSLQALIDGTQPRPMRKLAIVGRTESEDALERWMEKRHGDPDDHGAA